MSRLKALKASICVRLRGSRNFCERCSISEYIDFGYWRFMGPSPFANILVACRRYLGERWAFQRAQYLLIPMWKNKGLRTNVPNFLVTYDIFCTDSNASRPSGVIFFVSSSARAQAALDDGVIICCRKNDPRRCGVFLILSPHLNLAAAYQAS